MKVDIGISASIGQDNKLNALEDDEGALGDGRAWSCSVTNWRVCIGNGQDGSELGALLCQRHCYETIIGGAV